MRNRYSAATHSILHHARCAAEALGVPNGLSTKHLLLALLYDSQSKTVRALASLGVSVERIRAEVEAQAEQEDEAPLPVVPAEETQQPIERLWRDYAENPTRERLHDYTSTRWSLTLYNMHPARQAVFSAYNYVRRLEDSDLVEPHHLLLALMREKGGLANRVFAHLNLSFNQIYEALKQTR